MTRRTTASKVARLIGGGTDRHDVGFGWVLDGAGPARYGWYRRTPAGGQRWLGKSLAAIEAGISRGDGAFPR